MPWSRGRDFDPDDEWRDEEAWLPPAARSALLVNLLTEDNLPYYFQTIDRVFGPDHPWPTWTRRWTAEEMRHATVIRDYLCVTRAIDLVELERARMAHVWAAQTPQPPTPADGIVYLTLQELATRISHRNTGKVLDAAGYEVMARVAADENLHYLFYRDVGVAAVEVDPTAMVLAMERQVINFEMPGTGMPGFAGHARAISSAGIYDLSIHHEQILVPVVLRHWRLEQLTGLTDEAERARDRVLAFLEKSGRVARRLAERRQAQPVG